MAAVQADEDRLADQEVADVQLHHLGDGRDRLDGLVVDAVAGMDLQAQRRGLRPPRPAGRPARPRPRRRRRRGRRRNRRRCAARPPGRRRRAAASIWAGSGSMNRDTRMPASVSCATTGAIRVVAADHVQPALGGDAPRAARAPGRRRAGGGAGRWPASPGSPPSPGSAAAPRSRSRSVRLSMSASEMWRRSSRRWAVMPSAPAASASRAARTGSGWTPPRAFRTVATWSMLTPRRTPAHRRHFASLRLPGSSIGMAASSGGRASAG